MKSMTPIKSMKLVAVPAKNFDERDDKGVVTSVHGIINTEFTNFADFYNAAEGRKKSLSNYKNKNVQIVTRDIKTIKLEMPVFGLEHAVVYTKNKPTKVSLRKKIFKKINLEDRPASNILKKIQEEMKNEKKDTKSVAFLNELENISQEEVIRNAMIKTKQNVPSHEISKNESKESQLQVEVTKNFTSQGIQMKTSFESKIPKPTKFFKNFIKSNTVDVQKVNEVQSGRSTTSLRSGELERVESNRLKSRSKSSQSDSVTSQVSKDSQKMVGASKKGDIVASTSNANARSSKVRINVSEKKLTDLKKTTSDKSRQFNKNIQKKASVSLPVKSKATNKPIKEIKNILQEIPMTKKNNSNKNSKKK